MNLNQVTLPVSNMELATEFYMKLGFTQIVDTPHYAGLNVLMVVPHFPFHLILKRFTTAQ